MTEENETEYWYLGGQQIGSPRGVAQQKFEIIKRLIEADVHLKLLLIGYFIDEYGDKPDVNGVSYLQYLSRKEYREDEES